MRRHGEHCAWSADRIAGRTQVNGLRAVPRAQRAHRRAEVSVRWIPEEGKRGNVIGHVCGSDTGTKPDTGAWAMVIRSIDRRRLGSIRRAPAWCWDSWRPSTRRERSHRQPPAFADGTRSVRGGVVDRIDRDGPTTDLGAQCIDELAGLPRRLRAARTGGTGERHLDVRAGIRGRGGEVDRRAQPVPTRWSRLPIARAAGDVAGAHQLMLTHRRPDGAFSSVILEARRTRARCRPGSRKLNPEP